MIFIVGAARSGTTLATRVAEHCGARLGTTTGLAEHVHFKKQWVYPELQARGFDRRGQRPIPSEPITDMDPLEVRARLTTLLSDANCVKDVKMVLFWPILIDAFPEAIWICMRRTPEKVAESCMRAPFMNAYRTRKDWTTWAKVYHGHCDALRDANPGMVYEVTVDDLGDPEGPFAAAMTAAGLKWSPEAVEAVFKPEKWTGA